MAPSSKGKKKRSKHQEGVSLGGGPLLRLWNGIVVDTREALLGMSEGNHPNLWTDRWHEEKNKRTGPARYRLLEGKGHWLALVGRYDSEILLEADYMNSKTPAIVSTLLSSMLCQMAVYALYISSFETHRPSHRGLVFMSTVIHVTGSGDSHNAVNPHQIR